MYAYSVLDDLEANDVGSRKKDLSFTYYFSVSTFNISNGVDFSSIDDLGADENVYGQ